ncbi:MAG: hypothetical protein ACFFG0_56860 [Candidatus Thorarchaeota archaeon]
MNIFVKFWKERALPFIKNIFSKTFRYLKSLFKRTAENLANKIPEWIIEPIKSKIIELAQNQDLKGSEKMKMLKDFAVNLLGDNFATIGDSALDTFLQVLYQDLKDKGLA